MSINNNNCVVLDPGNSRIRAGNLEGIKISSPNVMTRFNPISSNLKNFYPDKNPFIVSINNGDTMIFGESAEEYCGYKKLTYDRSESHSLQYRCIQSISHIGWLVKKGFAEPEKDIVAGVSCTFKDLKNIKKSFIKYTKNTRVTFFNFDGSVNYKCVIPNIKFMFILQGYASYLTFSYNNPYSDYSKKDIIVVDIGSKTLLINRIRNNKLLLNQVRTFELGTKPIYLSQRNELQRHGYSKDIYELEQHHISNKGKMQFYDGVTIEDKDILPEIIKNHFITVRNVIHSEIEDESPDIFLMTGGGSILLKKHLPKLFKIPIEYLDNPLTSNFEGAKIYLKTVLESE